MARLFKLTYAEPAPPQPVLAWSSGPREVRVAFDRPLEPETLHELSSKTTIEYGPAVAAGDRFETLRPGYAVVAGAARPTPARAGRPRRERDARPSHAADRDRSSVGRPAARDHPSRARPFRRMRRPNELPQRPEVDLAYSLNGVEAALDGGSGGRIDHDLAAAPRSRLGAVARGPERRARSVLADPRNARSAALKRAGPARRPAPSGRSAGLDRRRPTARREAVADRPRPRRPPGLPRRGPRSNRRPRTTA